jgi:superfamily II DNA or RNA helicase/HKD family nuclease
MGLIDNKSQTMQEALNNSLDSTEQVDILTAFFYFSGFSLIADKLADKKIRILVGTSVEPAAVEELLAAQQQDPSIDLAPYTRRTPLNGRTERKKEYIDSFVELFNKSSLYDQTSDQKSYELFEKKLRDGSLEIKLTNVRNHAKTYILRNKMEFSQGGDAKGVVFMGSSNFTYQGLKGQGELNDSFRNNDDFDKYNRHFEDLWESSEAIELQTKQSNDEFIKEVERKIWIHATPDPYKIYIRILHELFGKASDKGILAPHDITSGQFSNLKYQLDAIRDGLDCVKNNDGVIIADVVGLGKSIIGSAIAHNLDMQHTIIIAPPHLVPQWKSYVQDFGLRGALVESSGKIESLYEEYAESKTPILFIIDEAHRYRNEKTFDYQWLHQLTRSHVDNKVILLTATPFNNAPADVFALIKLFQTPSRSTIHSVDNLSIRFRDLIAEFTKLKKLRKSKADEEKINELAMKISNEIRRLIEPVVIRRSRVDLRDTKEYADDLARQGIDFADVVGPELVSYDLGKLAPLYLETLQTITGENAEDGFIGARYKPMTYLKDKDEFRDKYRLLFDDSDLQTAQTNLAQFMRRLLVTRFESSKYAFETTLGSIIRSNEAILSWWDKHGKVPILKKGSLPSPEDIEFDENDDIDSILANLDTELEEKVSEFKKKGVYVDSMYISPAFIIDVQSDLKILKDIQSKWFGQGSLDIDPKLDEIESTINKLMSENPKRKVVIFSAYADTAKYVYKSLTERGLKRVMLYTGSSSAEEKRTVTANFDASIDSKSNKFKDDYDVIIATDALSEGFNLHRAGVVINYDIPYNPTRIIQRVGRINRINKKVYNELYVYNCFPTAVGEAITGTKEISTLKMLLISNIVGSDTRTLTPDEDIKSMWQREYKEADAVNNQKSWDVEHRNRYDAIKHDTALMEDVLSIPERTRIIRTNQSENIAVSFAKKGSGVIFAKALIGLDAEITPADIVLDYFVADPVEESTRGDDKLDNRFAILRDKLTEPYPQPRIDGVRADALKILEFLQEKHPSQKDYLIDLANTIRNYDDLSDGEMKYIAQIKFEDGGSEEEFERTVKNLKEKFSLHYIGVIKQRAERGENLSETIMFTEDLRK